MRPPEKFRTATRFCAAHQRYEGRKPEPRAYLQGLDVRTISGRRRDIFLDILFIECNQSWVLSPAKIAHGIGTIPSHPVRGLNETVEGVAQSAAPLVGATMPGAIPAAVVYGGIGRETSKVAEGLGADPETAELIGNAASIAAPGALPRIGRVVERNSGPIGKAVGIGTGIYEAART